MELDKNGEYKHEKYINKISDKGNNGVNDGLVTSSPTYTSNFCHKILGVEVGASFCNNVQTVGSPSIALMC